MNAREIIDTVAAKIDLLASLQVQADRDHARGEIEEHIEDLKATLGLVHVVPCCGIACEKQPMAEADDSFGPWCYSRLNEGWEVWHQDQDGDGEFFLDREAARRRARALAARGGIHGGYGATSSIQTIGAV